MAGMSQDTQTKPIVIFGFDMETDIGSWTPFYEGLLHGTPRILELLADHGIKATFFFTGIAAKTHPEVVKMVDDAGHEVGCHSLYHETVGDEMFPIPGVVPLLPEECYHRLELATEWVEQELGKKVTSFRAPRLWGSTAVVNALEALGYSADSSYAMCLNIDRLIPYHPSSEDWTHEGTMKILEIPNFADMTIETNDPWGRDRNQWPIFRTKGAEALMYHIDNMLGLYAGKNLRPVLSMYLHPWEFYRMPECPIYYGEGGIVVDPILTHNCGEVACRELDNLISILADRQAEFLTIRDLTTIY